MNGINSFKDLMIRISYDIVHNFYAMYYINLGKVLEYCLSGAILDVFIQPVFESFLLTKLSLDEQTHWTLIYSMLRLTENFSFSYGCDILCIEITITAWEG